MDTLSKSMPSSAHKLAHILHLLSDENLSMYEREDFLRVLFYAAAPLFVVCIFSKFEYLRDRGMEEGRAGQRLFASMSDRLTRWYLVYKWVQTPLYLIRIVAVKPASEWLFSALDVLMESIITDGIFVLWMFFVCMAADFWLGV